MRIDSNMTYDMAFKPKQPSEHEKALAKQTYINQMEAINNETEESKNKQDISLKCLIISGRIMSGDKVPQSDHRFLQKHDPELYGKAILMRIPKKDPHEYKRISEEESDETSYGPAPSADAPLPEIKLDIQV